MPQLASMLSVAPATSIGRLSAASSFVVAPSASLRSATSGSSTANSSAPMRATVSLERVERSRRRATSRSSASPWARPSVSFTSRKRSRSSVSRAGPSSSPVARRSACAVRWLSSERFGRPVSVS